MSNLPHCGIVAIVGRANVGKSTLMNRILGEKVSIVSPVAQTTRNMIRGILTDGRGQLVLLATPGVHKAAHDLGRIMNRAARLSVEGADAVLLVVDGAAAPRAEDEGWFRKLAALGGRLAVAINKCDLGERHAAAYRESWAAATATGATVEPAWFRISAGTGEAVNEMAGALFDMLPEGPPLFDEELLTDFPRKWNISDVIREKLFPELHDELPHAIAVRVDGIAEGDEWTVDATLLVDRPSQKGIVIGHKGRLLRKVKRLAEAELTSIYGRPVALNLWVKVEPHWARNHFILKQLGYVT
jgi:GTP-binding protein Era